MDEPYEPLIDRLESDVRALCSVERAWREPHVADVVLPGEDPVAFVVIRVRLEEQLRPEGDLEREAILTITAARWRRWRIERVYRELMVGAVDQPAAPVGDRERRSRLAAEARVLELAGTARAPAPAGPPAEASEGDLAMHPTEHNMKPWLVRMGEGGAAAPAAPARPAPGTAAEAMADRLARKLGGEAVDEDDEAWSGAG